MVEVVPVLEENVSAIGTFGTTGVLVGVLGIISGFSDGTLFTKDLFTKIKPQIIRSKDKAISGRNLTFTATPQLEILDHLNSTTSVCPENFLIVFCKLISERYPFLKTTILSIIPKLIPRIWQNKAIAFQLK